MTKDIKELNDKIDIVQKGQSKMMLYLYNDEDTDNKGLIQQVRELKKDVDTLKEKDRFRTFKVTTISSVLGGIGGWIVKLLW